MQNREKVLWQEVIALLPIYEAMKKLRDFWPIDTNHIMESPCKKTWDQTTTFNKPKYLFDQSQE